MVALVGDVYVLSYQGIATIAAVLLHVESHEAFVACSFEGFEKYLASLLRIPLTVFFILIM